MVIETCPLFPMPGTPSMSDQRNPTYLNLVLDAVGEKLAAIIQAPKAGTISKVAFRTSVTVTTPGNVDVRLETVDGTTGHPSGTLLGANSNGTQAVAAAITWYTTTLTTGVAVTAGQELAVVLANLSGNYQIAAMDSVAYQAAYPYGDFFTASWAKQQSPPVLALEYSDGSYEYIVGIFAVTTLQNETLYNINTVADGDERGLKWQLPFGHRVAGVWFHGLLSGDGEVVLYDSNGTTVLANKVFDKDNRYISGSLHGNIFFQFTTAANCLANTDYRVVVKPTTTTGLSFYYFIAPSLAAMAAMPGGTNFMRTTRADAGAWTDTNTHQPWMGLLINGIEADAGIAKLIGDGMVS